MNRWLAFAVVTALYLLHNDLWWWREPGLFLGLPVGLAYHLGYCFVVSLSMAWLVKVAWPRGLDESEPESERPR